MLEQLIEEEVLYLAARDSELTDDEEIRRQLEAARRQILVQAYLDRAQERASRVADEEARAFYESHRADYVMEERRRIRLLLTDRPGTLSGVQRMLEEGAITFENACSQYSTHPQVIAAGGLLPGWIRKGWAVPWFGNRPDFHEIVFSLPQGVVSGPYELEIGHALILVEEIRPARQRGFEEVKRDVLDRLARERSTTGLPKLLAELKERYRVKVHDSGDRSPEEIFAAAQAAGDPRERIDLYRTLVERHPDHARALESWFMIGFIRSEELHDREGAREAFEKVIALDGDSELAQSARWMLTSDDEELPPFEDEPLSDAAEEGTR